MKDQLENNEMPNTKSCGSESKIGLCMVMGIMFGTSLGTALGAIFDEVVIYMSIGPSIGMCAGIVIGAVLDGRLIQERFVLKTTNRRIQFGLLLSSLCFLLAINGSHAQEAPATFPA